MVREPESTERRSFVTFKTYDCMCDFSSSRNIHVIISLRTRQALALFICILSVFILVYSRRPRCQKHLHLRQLLPPRDTLKTSAALLPRCQSLEVKLVASCRSSGRCAPTWMRSKAFYFIHPIQCESTSVGGIDEFHRDVFLLF